jgi:hypothetical protein
MTDDRSTDLARRVGALTGMTVIEATEDGCAEEVLWILRRRAADFRAAGRPREAMAEARAARAWEHALRRSLDEARAVAPLWAAARAAAADRRPQARQTAGRSAEPSDPDPGSLPPVRV